MKMTLLLLGGLLLLASIPGCEQLPHVRVLHDPLTPAEHVTLGQTYEMQGHEDLAAREYRTALTQKAGYVPALIGLGNVAFAEGKLEESETYYRQALAASPEDPGANNNLAMLYLTRGVNLQEVEQLALRAVAQAGPLHPYVLDTLAHVYTQQGRYKEAVAVLDEAVATAPLEDRFLRERLIRSRNELMEIDSQADRREPAEPGARRNPQRVGDLSVKEVQI